MIYVKVNEALYIANIEGKNQDHDWDNRESKAITLNGTYEEVNALFHDGTPWSIVEENAVSVVDENGEVVMDENGEATYQTERTEYDNSDFYIRGDLTVHVDGTCTVKMGKSTDLEDAYEILYGGM